MPCHAMTRKKRQFRFRIPCISSHSRPKQTSQLHITPPQPPPPPPPPQHPLPTSLERNMMFAIATSNPGGKEFKVPLTINDENSPMQAESNAGMKNDVPNFVNKVATTVNPNPTDEKAFNVVTLAGENRGATMNVAGTQQTAKNRSTDIHPATNKEEEKAFVNSNIQSINNSFMLHGSINGRDPGVRVNFPQHHHEAADYNKRGLENNRAEVNNVSQVEKLTYPRPIVRRRCLRGLLLEPSDSDPDNPNKPRRHGCKVTCGGDVGKGKDTGIL